MDLQAVVLWGMIWGEASVITAIGLCTIISVAKRGF